jgi:hypothetical protein
VDLHAVDEPAQQVLVSTAALDMPPDAPAGGVAPGSGEPEAPQQFSIENLEQNAGTAADPDCNPRQDVPRSEPVDVQSTAPIDAPDVTATVMPQDELSPIASERPDNFNEQWYLDHYLDVADAVKKGSFKSGLEHYVVAGRGEGRLPHPPADFDEDWYLYRYPDVAGAVEAGTLRSGLEHFIRAGRAEGRSPNMAVGR